MVAVWTASKECVGSSLRKSDDLIRAHTDAAIISLTFRMLCELSLSARHARVESFG